MIYIYITIIKLILLNHFPNWFLTRSKNKRGFEKTSNLLFIMYVSVIGIQLSIKVTNYFPLEVDSRKGSQTLE